MTDSERPSFSASLEELDRWLASQPTDRERTRLSVPTELPRPREEVEAFLAWVQSSESSYNPAAMRAAGRPGGAGDERYLAGVVETLRWVLGQRPTSPVDGRRTGSAPSRSDVVIEHRAASEGMTNLSGDDHRRQREHGRQYLIGAEHALSWLLGQPSFLMPDDWPWPGSD
jgi:hypothetical protein